MLYLVFVCGDASEVRTTISRTHIRMFPQGSVHSSLGSVGLVRRRRVGGGTEGAGRIFALGFLKLLNMFLYFCSSQEHTFGPLIAGCFFICFFVFTVLYSCLGFTNAFFVPFFPFLLHDG